MKIILLSVMLLFGGLAPTAFAVVAPSPEAASAEMKRHAADLPQTLVIRESNTTGRIEVYHSRTRLSIPAVSAAPAFDDSLFTPVDNAVGESGSANLTTAWPWNFFWNYNFNTYPYYGYYGYNYYYHPYYNYYSYPYNYWYYRWFW
ncbi:MAG: hypothetical protein ACXWQO_04815 [Bdellovibrionota bacterium]